MQFIGVLILSAIPWVDVPAVRTVGDSQDSVYADILCRVASHKTYDGNVLTIAHETVHAVNERIGNDAFRRSPPGPGVFLTGLYVGNGRGVVFAEPRVTKRQVYSCLPASLRGPNLFYVTGNRDSERLPFVLLDELTAFTLASEVLAERQELGIHRPLVRIEGNATVTTNDGFEVESMIELAGYAVSVLEAVSRFDHNYAQRAELTEFVNWQIARVAGILRRIRANGKSASPRQLKMWTAFCEALKGGAWPSVRVE